jgi:hypothetical protein
MFAARNRPFWVCMLLLLGVYLPTSSGGEITKGWTQFALMVVCLLLSILLVSERGRAKGDLLFIGSFILLLLLVFTPFSLLPIPVYGVLASFAVFSLLISIRFENIRATRLVERTFIFVNIANIFLGCGILFHLHPVQWLIENYYSAAYPELVPMMLDNGKPVLTYATHSLAGLVHYLFFWVNLCAYKQTGRRIHLWFSAVYLIFMLSLLSVSGLVFFGAALAQLMWTFMRGKTLMAALSVSFLTLALFATAKFLGNQGYFSEGIASEARDVVSSEGNGFLGRYSYAGNLLPVLDYLSEHPLRPAGLKTDDDWLLIDSGPIGYYVRGSIVLLVLMYRGFFLFLKRNLLNRRNAYFLFAVVVCFEVGFSALTSFRVVCILPIMIVYLNGLRVAYPKKMPSQQVLAVGNV